MSSWKHSACAALLGMGAALLLGGCQEPERPEESLRTFLEALYANQGEEAWPYLTQEAQGKLQGRADRINKANGSPEAAIEPYDLLTTSGFLKPHEIESITRAQPQDEPGERLELIIKTRDERELPVTMIHQGEHWRVSLALPETP